MSAVASQVVALLEGQGGPDPAQQGLTTEEERSNSSAPMVGLHTLVHCCLLQDWLLPLSCELMFCKHCCISGSEQLAGTAMGKTVPAVRCTAQCICALLPCS